MAFVAKLVIHYPVGLKLIVTQYGMVYDNHTEILHVLVDIE